MGKKGLLKLADDHYNVHKFVQLCLNFFLKRFIVETCQFKAFYI